MSWFFFKRKKLVLNCYTRSYSILNYAAPDHAHKFYPAWWKAMPTELLDENNVPYATAKRCEGIIEQYQHGFILPLWSDLQINYSEVNGPNAYRWQFADGESRIVVHPASQRGEFMPESHYLHVKLESPWVLKCEEDVPFQFLQPLWNFQEPNRVVVPNAIINYKYQHASNVNLLLPRNETASIITMEMGQPLAHIVPLSERELVMQHHMVDSEKDWSKLNFPAPYRTFTRKYRVGKTVLQKMEKRSCPFGFGGEK